MGDDRVLDMMQAARPTVRREVLADFLAGRIPGAHYLHVDPPEFRRMEQAATARTLELVAAWLDAIAPEAAVDWGKIDRKGLANRIRSGELDAWLKEREARGADSGAA